MPDHFPLRLTRAIASLILAALPMLSANLPAQSVKSSPSPSSIADTLRAPQSGSVPDPIDWSTVPPWDQASFFGIRARGQLFVYVIDCSGSMGDHMRLLRAKTELRRSISNLRFPQRFLVILYNDMTHASSGGVPQAASSAATTRLITWLRSATPEGETHPVPALKLALAHQPDAIFLLSDGEFPAADAKAILEANPNRIPIHAIDLSGGASVSLKRIAETSGGRHTAAE